jgi:hypothetical protein
MWDYFKLVYPDLTIFTILCDDYEAYKINNNSRFEILSNNYEQFFVLSFFLLLLLSDWFLTMF